MAKPRKKLKPLTMVSLAKALDDVRQGIAALGVGRLGVRTMDLEHRVGVVESVASKANAMAMEASALATANRTRDISAQTAANHAVKVMSSRMESLEQRIRQIGDRAKMLDALLHSVAVRTPLPEPPPPPRQPWWRRWLPAMRLWGRPLIPTSAG